MRTPLSWRQVTSTLDPSRWTVTTVPRQRRALVERWETQMRVTNARVRTEYGSRNR